MYIGYAVVEHMDFFRVKKMAGEECQLLNLYIIFFPYGRCLRWFNYKGNNLIFLLEVGRKYEKRK